MTIEHLAGLPQNLKAHAVQRQLSSRARSGERVNISREFFLFLNFKLLLLDIRSRSRDMPAAISADAHRSDGIGVRECAFRRSWLGTADQFKRLYAARVAVSSGPRTAS